MTVDFSTAVEGGDISALQTQKQNSAYSVFKDPSMKLLSEYYTNSSDFTRKSAGAEFGGSPATGLHLESGYIFSEFSQDGFDDILRHRLFIQGEKRSSESTGILASLSGNFYDNDNTNLNGGASIRYFPSEKVSAELSYRHFDIIDTVLPFNNIIYSHVVTIGPVDLNIRSDDYKLYLLYAPVPKVSFAGEVVHGDYSDGNRKNSYMFDAGYQALDNPYLRAAYNYFYLDIKDPAPLTNSGDHVESAYWDPEDFETHTLRLEYRQDYRKHLSVGAEGALSYSPKSDGLSKTAFLFLSYKFTEQSSLRFDVRWFDQNKGIDRQGTTDRYWAANYTVAFQHRF
ncbi:MAG: hypothetical protein HZC49_13745 [Nitrospirae bacterium]|nr:hypothetical protein [Nitrospirota bacterium]